MNIFKRISQFFSGQLEPTIEAALPLGIVIGSTRDELVQSIEKGQQLLTDPNSDIFKAFHFFFVPPQASFVDAHRDWPIWMDYLAWNTRNPFPGLNDALGCKGQDYTSNGATVGPNNPHGLTWNPAGGFNRLTHTITATGKRYEFISFRGSTIEWYCGTKPSGSFGVALRRAHAKGY